MHSTQVLRHRAKTQQAASGVKGYAAALLVLWMVVSAVRAAAKEKQSEKRPTEDTRSTAIPTLTYGTIATLNLASPAPSLTLTTEEGKTYVLPVDSKLTIVWPHTELDTVKIDQLKVGEKVKVHYGKKGQKQLADAILIVEEPPSTTSVRKATPVTWVGPSTPTIPTTTPSQAEERADTQRTR